MERLASSVRKGDRSAVAKGITLVEAGGPKAEALLRLARPRWHSFVLGVTGPPGTGKSTLVDKLIGSYRKKGLRVGVVAFDPTSPITGGALLGDRIRMTDHAGDGNVYIRSMASRGWSGGLSRAAAQTLQILDSAGYDIVLLETVGIGQSDIEVVGVSHAVLVVLMPGLGDDVQMSKAGLMEVGDLYVVNKADLEGADALVVSLLGVMRGSRKPSRQVVKVSATSGEGIEKLVNAIESIRARFQSGDEGIRLRSVRGMIVETARGEMDQKLHAVSEAKADKLARMVMDGRMTLGEAAKKLSH